MRRFDGRSVEVVIYLWMSNLVCDVKRMESNSLLLFIVCI